MRPSWNEIRARAPAFAEDWKDASYEKGEAQSFYYDFFEAFGVRRRTVARYEQHVEKLDNTHGFIDLFWPAFLLVEHKSAGRDLKNAYGQAGEYFDALPENERSRYILVSDIQTFELHELGERQEISFPLADLPKRVEAFGFILGVQRRTFRDQDPANIRTAELVGRLHDALDAAGYRGHDLERFLVRIVFCLFADDTGIFEPRDIFLDSSRPAPAKTAPISARGSASSSRCLTPPRASAQRRSTRILPDPLISTARCSRGRSASRPSTQPCGDNYWTPAASTG